MGRRRIRGVILNFGVANDCINVLLFFVKPIKWVLEKGRYLFCVENHYFDEYQKHLTIYKDGTGILINSLSIIFKRPKKDELRRGINIEDGKVQAVFPSLQKMTETKLDDRFSSFGFWYYSENDIISSVTEKYWSDDPEEDNEDYKVKNNDKEIRWIYKFNSSRIKPGKKYRIVYVMSIPGMFPILDGEIDSASINDPNLLNDGECKSSSSIEITHKIKKLIYTVSFENGITLDITPECSYNRKGHKQVNHPGILVDTNILYTKYTSILRHPRINSKIRIKWRFKGAFK